MDSYVSAGTELVEVADLRVMRARIYVSEHEIRRFHPGAPARLRIEGIFGTWESRAVEMTPVSSEIATGLGKSAKYKGLSPPHYYQVDVYIPNERNVLRPGMVGYARIYGSRRSLIRSILGEISDFFGRKLW
jgi:hypothetical protein